MSRKTFSVADLLEYTNYNLFRNDCDLIEKKALCCAIERVLMITGNYEGFGYNFDFNTMSEEEAHIRQWDRQYYVDKNLLDEYKSFRSERGNNNGFRR